MTVKATPFSVSQEWFEQAEHDLVVCRYLIDGQYYGWACYAAQQAAEKALKAARVLSGTVIEQIHTHRMNDLIGTLSDLQAHRPPSPMLIARASTLDPYNEGARYPGQRGKAGEAPHKTFEKATAEDAFKTAKSVLKFSQELIAELEKFWRPSKKGKSA